METAHDVLEMKDASTASNNLVSNPDQSQGDANSVTFHAIIEEIKNHEHSESSLLDLGQILETDSNKFSSELPELILLMLADILWRYKSVHAEHHFDEQFVTTTLSFLAQYIPNNVTMPHSADLCMEKLSKYDLRTLRRHSYSSRKTIIVSIMDTLKWFDDFQQNKFKFSTQFKWNVVDCILDGGYAPISDEEYEPFLSFHQRLPLQMYVIEDFIRRVRCHDGSTESELRLHRHLRYLDMNFLNRRTIAYHDLNSVYDDKLTDLDEMDQQTFDKLLSFLFVETSLNYYVYLYAIQCFLSFDWHRRHRFQINALNHDEITVEGSYCHSLLKKYIDDGNVDVQKMFISAWIRHLNGCSEIEPEMMLSLDILWGIIDSIGMQKSELLDEQTGSISDGFRDCLRQIFHRFASHHNEDGSMSAFDFRRYIIASGAGEALASDERIRWVFNTHEQMDATNLSFKGFCNFYKRAASDRPEMVWNDLITHQFLPDFKINDGVYEQDSLRDIMAKDEMYEEMVHNLFNRKVAMHGILDYQTGIRLWFHWPQSHVLRQRMFDSNTSIDDIFPSLGIMTEGNAKQMMHQAMTIHTFCQSDEWKKHFVEKGGMDCAVKMLHHLNRSLDTNQKQEFEMAFVYITNALYEICHGKCHGAYSRHLFLGNAMLMISSDLRMMPMFPRNVLIHVICYSASSSNNIDFLDELPRKIVWVHSLPLIQGYLRRKCIPSLHIPDGIVKLLTHFF